MTQAYQLERERNSQLNNMRRFARDCAVAEEWAVAVFEREWQRLCENARVLQFVGVLAERRAKEAVRGRLQ